MRKVFPYVISGFVAASFSQIAFAQSTDNSPRQNRGVVQTPGEDVRQEDRRADRREDRDQRGRDQNMGRHGQGAGMGAAGPGPGPRDCCNLAERRNINA
jgi:hypothetical protein